MCIRDRPTPPPAPAQEKPAAAEEKPAAPAEEKPAAAEEKPAAPAEEKPAAAEEKPAAPAEKPKKTYKDLVVGLRKLGQKVNGEMPKLHLFKKLQRN